MEQFTAAAFAPTLLVGDANPGTASQISSSVQTAINVDVESGAR